MNEDITKNRDNRNIESLLALRCDIKAPAGLTDRIMSEAAAHTSPHRYSFKRWILIAGSSAAILCGAVIALVLYTISSTADQSENLIASNSDSIKTECMTRIEDDYEHPLAQAPEQNMITEVAPSQPSETVAVAPKQVARHTQKQTPDISVSERTLPLTNKETIPDPEMIRVNMNKTQREYELAYIEYVRAEIKSNEEYVNKLEFIDSEM